jgi:signal transduction histidine kinase
MKGRGFKLFRRRVGQEVRAWPMLASLVLVVLVAVGCVLWFMREAMQNERMAVREELAEAYRGQLTLLEKQATERWGAQTTFASGGLAASDFADHVRKGTADSIIICNLPGEVFYPTITTSGRSAQANADLLALETWTERKDEAYRNALARLEAKASNYETVTLPSTQRRFLMHELQRLDPGVQFPTLYAEELAARFLEANPTIAWGKPLWATRQDDIWSMAGYGRHERVVVLFTTTGLRSKLAKIVHEVGPPRDVNITILAPGEDDTNTSAVASAAFGPELPGWRLSLSVNNRALFDTEAEHRVARYLLIGSGVIAAMLVLAFFMARGFGRQVQLARLKNDLVANVSHELKTPLTAMRALVDTLLDTERLDEKTTREYLKLLGTENARLSRLIDNFLTFSRLERNKFKFEFARVSPQRIVDGAVAAMGERAHAPGCTVESHVAAGIPEINGDADALTTALLNLLDNAWKYSGDNKHIMVRAEARDGHVDFAVEDNGIGLSPQEQRRVFRRFYQSDQRLARTVGGCGLGLSIVQSIVEAHHGTVRVESEVGHGSTFIMEIPAVGESAL